MFSLLRIINAASFPMQQNFEISEEPQVGVVRDVELMYADGKLYIKSQDPETNQFSYGFVQMTPANKDELPNDVVFSDSFQQINDQIINFENDEASMENPKVSNDESDKKKENTSDKKKNSKSQNSQSGKSNGTASNIGISAIAIILAVSLLG
ncbi:hypothetical protein NUSPORA_01592 [Nucleospora cyclopteri]